MDSASHTLLAELPPLPWPAVGHAEEHTRYEPGLVIDGKYRLDRLLGEGGMGCVWRATNLHFDYPVALKLIRAGLDRVDVRLRLQLEARAAASLAHAGIVRVFDVGQSSSGDPFIVMELLAGKTLTECSTEEPLRAAEAVQLVLPIVDALAVAHAHGIVHRDLKPDNIFIADDGYQVQPKLLDFGVAKSSGATSGITQAGTLIGTPEYMAPEAARGESNLDCRADIWSLCVVLYEQITGMVPFQGDNLNAVLCSIIEQEPKPIAAELLGDGELWQILRRGLEKQPERRFQSMTELGAALASWLVTRGVHVDASGQLLKKKWLCSEARATSEPGAAVSGARASRLSKPWLLAPALAALAVAFIGFRVLPTSAQNAPVRAEAAPTAAAQPSVPRGNGSPSREPAPAPSVAPSHGDNSEQPARAAPPAKADQSRRAAPAKVVKATSVPPPAAGSPRSDLIAPY